MNKNEIIRALIANNYPEKQAFSVAEELIHLDNSLLPLLNSWILKEEETDVTIEGFSLIELKNRYKMTYPAALLTMDWLKKEPQLASYAIGKGLK